MATNSYSFLYDLIGNRIRATENMTETEYLSNALNQYTNITAMATPVYDLDGNTVSVNGWTYTWDAENRLTGASNGNQRLEFLYDYMSRRVFKKVYALESEIWNLKSEMLFAWDGWNMISEIRNEGPGLATAPSTNFYVWGQDLSGSLQGAGGVGGLLSMTRIDGGTSNTYFYCMDGNGNVVDMVDAEGNKVAHYEYGPFGQTLVATGPMAQVNPFRFSSKYTDNETGLVMYQLRPYSPEQGRFVQRDRIGEYGGFMLYGLVNNNPLCATDYLGLVNEKGQTACEEELEKLKKWYTDAYDEATSKHVGGKVSGLGEVVIGTGAGIAVGARYGKWWGAAVGALLDIEGLFLWLNEHKAVKGTEELLLNLLKHKLNKLEKNECACEEDLVDAVRIKYNAFDEKEKAPGRGEWEPGTDDGKNDSWLDKLLKPPVVKSEVQPE
jgi:RHS repeat-associated protein